MIAIPQYKGPISLIPGGCPQLLDFSAPASLLDEIKYAFEEQREKSPDRQTRIVLHAFRRNDAGEMADEADPSKLATYIAYEPKAARSIEPFLGHWLPLPFLRMRDQSWPDSEEPRFEYGPVNWARSRLVREDGNLRLVIAFDMQVEEKGGDAYTALSPEDVDANAHFRLAWRFRDNAWFMDLPWVEKWLRELWEAWRKKNKRRQEEQWHFEHLAGYLVYLEAVRRASANHEVYVIRPDGKNCVDVDFVLDIGNSRTTGILVETHVQSATNLNHSYLLQLRDMTRPENIYTEPFETRVEFSRIHFGNDALSLRSGRRVPAFVWPSPVRIGPEAARLATLSRCEKGSTGMSSPKRYLWDERDWKRTWRFNTGTEESPYVTSGPLAQRVNSSGTPLCCMDDKLFTKNKNLNTQERESAFESLFTRSSLMMFLLVEIIQQALLTINLPGQRMRRELPAQPRRLRQIIFTVPAGMPMAEQKIYRRWANWAVRVLWDALGWSQYYVSDQKRLSANGDRDYRESPTVRCDWDEATCTQLVFIYNEISRKFQGDASLFCALLGKERDFNGKKVPSARVAAIDIGGGTTDLSITTFELASGEGSTPRMAPHPEFHDGFSLAGDDILRAVVKEHVLGSLAAALEKAGVSNTRQALAAMFGRDTMDSSREDFNHRVQFIRQIAVPASLCLLSLYEKTDARKPGVRETFRLADCFERAAAPARSQEDGQERELVMPCGKFPMASRAALDYVSSWLARNYGIDNFSILELPLVMNAEGIDKTVRDTLMPVLANLCEVINLYDCDALLLTGRPSRWPGIKNAIYSLLPLPESRIFPMADYPVGAWYPFADALGNMTDPKTTVVTGAILCALAEGQLEGFSFDPHSLRLVSTARYIGEMELSGQITRQKVWFKVDPESGKAEPEKRTIEFSGPLAVGFRQLEEPRWTTSRFYFLEYADAEAQRIHSRNLPLKVTLSLVLDEEDSGEGETDSRRDEGGFEIDEIVDRNGDDVNVRALAMRLRTLPRDEGFWMDTGVVSEDF